MTDLEMLQYAAKAAGMTLGAWHESRLAFMYRDASPGPGYWNPLKSDGDAFRLAVKCLLFYTLRYSREDWEECGEDGYAATRLAIVRAAAQIGKEME
jgi:hypothetical protein